MTTRFVIPDQLPDSSQRFRREVEDWITVVDEISTFIAHAFSVLIWDEPDSRAARAEVRETRTLLPPDTAQVARGIASRYASTMESLRTHLATGRRPQLVWGLTASTTEVTSYIRFERWGADLSRPLYQEMFESELAEHLQWQWEIITAPPTIEDTSPHYFWSFDSRPTSSVAELLPLTLGVEEEYQMVDMVSGDLVARGPEFFAGLACESVSFSGEVYKSQLELQTADICTSVAEVESALNTGRRYVVDALREFDLRPASAGTHPFAHWEDQSPTESRRLDLFLHDMADVVRRLLTWGLHVHVGVADRELALQIAAASRRFLPLLLALSANSPFSLGRWSGLECSRIVAFSGLPRTGLPPLFPTLKEYEEYLDILAGSRALDSLGSRDATKIWWDVRPHGTLPTVEFRIFDACTTVDETTCLTALTQALVSRLGRMLIAGEPVPREPRWVTEENRWRASRYGHRASFINYELRRAVPISYTFTEFLDFIHDDLERLGTSPYANLGWGILERGSGASRQKSKVIAGGSLRDVVTDLCGAFANPSLNAYQRAAAKS